MEKRVAERDIPLPRSAECSYRTTRMRAPARSHAFAIYVGGILPTQQRPLFPVEPRITGDPTEGQQVTLPFNMVSPGS